MDWDGGVLGILMGLSILDLNCVVSVKLNEGYY